MKIQNSILVIAMVVVTTLLSSCGEDPQIITIYYNDVVDSTKTGGELTVNDSANSNNNMTNTGGTEAGPSGGGMTMAGDAVIQMSCLSDDLDCIARIQQNVNNDSTKTGGEIFMLGEVKLNAQHMSKPVVFQYVPLSQMNKRKH